MYFIIIPKKEKAIYLKIFITILFQKCKIRKKTMSNRKRKIKYGTIISVEC